MAARAYHPTRDGGWIDAAYRVVENHQYEKVEGVLLDAMTAGALVAVDKALSPPNRAKFRAMDLSLAVTIAWKLVAKHPAAG